MCRFCERPLLFRVAACEAGAASVTGVDRQLPVSAVSLACSNPTCLPPQICRQLANLTAPPPPSVASALALRHALRLRTPLRHVPQLHAPLALAYARRPEPTRRTRRRRLPGQPRRADCSGEPGSSDPASPNGRQRAPAVRSGLAHRRNPVLVTLGELARARTDGACAIRSRCFCCSPRSGWRSRSRPARRHQAEQRRDAGAAQHRADAGQTPRDLRRLAARPRQPRRDHHDGRRRRRSRVHRDAGAVANGPADTQSGARHRESRRQGAVPACTAQRRLQRCGPPIPPRARMTQQLLRELDDSGANVAVDQQSGKGDARRSSSSS